MRTSLAGLLHECEYLRPVSRTSREGFRLYYQRIWPILVSLGGRASSAADRPRGARSDGVLRHLFGQLGRGTVPILRDHPASGEVREPMIYPEPEAPIGHTEGGSAYGH